MANKGEKLGARSEANTQNPSREFLHICQRWAEHLAPDFLSAHKKKKRGGRPDQVWVSRTIKQTVKESATVLYIEPERNFFLCPHREESIWCYLFFKKSNLHPLSKWRHQCTVLISYTRWCLIIYIMRTSFTNVMIWIKRTTMQLSIRIFCSAYSILHSN